MDDQGDCAIDGHHRLRLGRARTSPRTPTANWPGSCRRSPLIGTGSIASRLYSSPSVNVVGLDAPDVATAPNAIIPMARAKISVRIPPGVDAERRTQALAGTSRPHAPWGVTVEFEPAMPANGTAMPDRRTRPTRRSAPRCAVAYGTASRPSRASAARSRSSANLLEAFPDLEVLGIGAQDPLARIHAPNESIDLDGTAAVRSLAQVLFLADYAGARGG